MARSIIQNDAKIFRYYADEALDMYGIVSQYYQCKPGKSFTTLGELKSCYYDPIRTKVIFDQAPQVRTLKKLGWVTELDSQQPIIHVKYDLPGLEVGCLFNIKDPLAVSSGRMFRVTKMSVGILYPATVTCQVVAIVGDSVEETTNPYNGPESIFLNKEAVDEDTN